MGSSGREKSVSGPGTSLFSVLKRKRRRGSEVTKDFIHIVCLHRLMVGVRGEEFSCVCCMGLAPVCVVHFSMEICLIPTRHPHYGVPGSVLVFH